MPTTMNRDASTALAQIPETLEASRLLQEVPILARLAERVAALLNQVRAKGAPITAIRLEAPPEPEQPLIFSVSLAVEPEQAYEQLVPWWKRASALRVELAQQLPEPDRSILLVGLASTSRPKAGEELTRPTAR